MADFEDSSEIVQNLLKDLEISQIGDEIHGKVNLEPELNSLFKASKSKRTIFFDASLLAASMGAWDKALDWCQSFERTETLSESALVWKMRCLVENERFSEALALGSSCEWASHNLIHVKYLSGICYKSLKMHDRARVFFEWVERQDSGYREVARMLTTV